MRKELLIDRGALDLALRLVPVLILAFAVPGKFTGDPVAVGVFGQLGVEPAGRYATGVFEAIGLVLLLAPRTAIYGALLVCGLMTGAVAAHLLVLGVAPGGDPWLLPLAVAALLSSAVLVFRRRAQIPLFGDVQRSGAAPVH